MAPGAEAAHKVPGFKPHTRPKGQVSYLGGQGLSTHGYLLALGALVQNSPEVTHTAGRDRATVRGEQNCRDASSFGLEYNHRGTASIKELSFISENGSECLTEHYGHSIRVGVGAVHCPPPVPRL